MAAMDGGVDSSGGSRVLCVLSEGQADDYRDEFLQMGAGRAEFLFEESPDDALEQLGDINPSLVIVGMDLGSMEGLEFLAILMRRYPTFMQKVLVLPERDDPFPPMLQFRDPDTGRSVTEQTDLGALPDLIRTAMRSSRPEAMPLPSAASPLAAQWGAEVAASMPPDSIPAIDGGAPDVLVPGPAPLPNIPMPGAQAPQPPSPARSPARAAPVATPSGGKPSQQKLLLIAAAVLALLIVIVLLMRSGGEPEAGEAGEGAGDPGAAAVVPSEPAPEPTEPPAAEEAQEQAAADPAGDEAPAEAEPAEPAEEEEPPPAPRQVAGELSKRVSLPLSFPKGRAAYRVDDEAAFDRIVASFAAALEQHPGKRLEVGGHTSQEGSKQYNVVLGKKRALRLRTDLAGKGIPMRRMVVRNYVLLKQALPDEPDQPSARRRVTLRLID